MTFTHSAPDTGPRWVVSFPPGVSLSAQTIDRIREHLDPDDLRPIVLEQGGMMYDARVGPPVTLGAESTLESVEVEVARPWALYLAVLLNALATILLASSFLWK